MVEHFRKVETAGVYGVSKNEVAKKAVRKFTKLYEASFTKTSLSVQTEFDTVIFDVISKPDAYLRNLQAAAIFEQAFQ